MSASIEETARSSPARPLRGVFVVWRSAAKGLARDVDHAGVQASIGEGGMLSGRYVLMTVLSAAIAMLGLLLSSPAVIIGAMLLSPLMGPIVLLGFSFWMLDWAATRRALVSLALGFGLAFVVALLLTLASPLKESTGEILARSRPTLFDLLVAIFSGIAGGYAVIRQRGETVIGVAIATALMPPVATIAFGVGVGQWAIALGALLLFTTNLVAIAMAAAVVAAVYGFRARFRKHGWVSRAAVTAVLLALCVPLTLSLQTIALESRATAATRSEIRTIFGPKARVTSLTVRAEEAALSVDALVATPKAVPHAGAALATRLKRLAPHGLQVALDQVVLADPSRITPTAPTPAVAQQTLTDPLRTTGDALRQAIAFPTRAIALDPTTGQAVILLPPDSVLDLNAAMALETALLKRGDLPKVRIIPPLRGLAPIALTGSGDALALGPPFAAEAWALQRWGAAAVQARLCANGHGPSLDRVRALFEAGLPNVEVKVSKAPPRDCRLGDTPLPFLSMQPK